MIDKKIAKLNFEQKGLKESVDVNWEITDKNQQKQEKTDEQIKVLEEENARVKESVTENNNSQDYTNEDLKILEAKITTLAITGDQPCVLKDERHAKCEMCDKTFANNRQLIQHNKMEHRKGIICTICEQ